VYLAFEIRNVNFTELSESKFISLAIYGMFILGIALTPIGYFLTQYAAVQYGTMGALLLIGITLILGILYVPKVRMVFACQSVFFIVQYVLYVRCKIISLVCMILLNEFARCSTYVRKSNKCFQLLLLQ
jgi:predicted tellurium resistance membrane protein TerC